MTNIEIPLAIMLVLLIYAASMQALTLQETTESNLKIERLRAECIGLREALEKISETADSCPEYDDGDPITTGQQNSSCVTELKELAKEALRQPQGDIDPKENPWIKLYRKI